MTRQECASQRVKRHITASILDSSADESSRESSRGGWGEREGPGVTVFCVTWHSKLETVILQMGGAEGVRNSEEVAITLAPSKGLFMHAEPRQT